MTASPVFMLDDVEVVADPAILAQPMVSTSGGTAGTGV